MDNNNDQEDPERRDSSSLMKNAGDKYGKYCFFRGKTGISH
jgi:hypothetical protein